MKLFASLTLGAALLAAGARAQTTTVKTKEKTPDGLTVKTKAAGPAVRVETVSGIDVYPRPGTNHLLLSFTQQFTKPGTLTMTDARQRVIYQQALNPQTTTGAPVDLGPLPGGVYLVEARTGNYVYWKQVRVKQAASRRR